MSLRTMCISKHNSILTLSLTLLLILSSIEAGWPVAAQATTVPVVQATLVATIATSSWRPASPDPSGITYWPARDRLVVIDGEVDEMPIYAGANLFLATRDGTLTDVGTTKPWSREPVGIEIAIDPLSRHFFISDDNQKRVFDVDIGRDGRPGTGDDTIRSFSTVVYGNSDPEGLAFGDDGTLYLTNGVGAKVHRIRPGVNGIFDGMPPNGDDVAGEWATGPLGQHDPEGIDFHQGLLYIVSRSQQPTIAEVTADGRLVRTIGLTNIKPVAPADLTWAPATNTTEEHIYLVARGVDNNQDPNENDGALYEIAVPNVVPAPGDNLLLNPGFELDANGDGPDNWSANSYFTRSTAQVHGGGFAGRHQATDSSSYTIRQQVNGLSPTSYTFSGWVYIPPTSDSFSFKLHINWFDGSGKSIRTNTIQVYSTAINGWQHVSKTLTAPTGTTTARLLMTVSSLDATIYVDDFSLSVAG
jgi:hypothetical protein